MAPSITAEGGAGTPARVAVSGAALVAATAAIAVLETWVGVADASPVYLLAVVLTASLLGTWAAVATSLVSFLVYDFLFTSPRFTFTVADPAEWLSLLLFLVVAVVIGRLTALLRERADTAERRAREGAALVAISRATAMATSFEEAAADVADRLRTDAEMEAVWVTRGDPAGGRHRAGDAGVAGAGTPVPGLADPWELVRESADGSSSWRRLTSRGGGDRGGTAGVETYVVPIGAREAGIGAIVATRATGSPEPGRGARRILSLAADQLEIAHRRDELRARLTEAEVARRSDALRAAILDSVSHDLRTPISSIRAIAGGLADSGVDVGPEERRSAILAIDAEAEQLAELVAGLLDMSRVQAGALRPDLQPYELEEVVDAAIRRAARDGPPRSIEIDVPPTLPPVLADAALLDVALVNVLANALRYAPPPARILVRARPLDALVALSVEDGGPGVPEEALGRLFDRFYRAPSGPEPARHGLGLGLAVARGFLEAMGATIDARRSELGGLAIRLVLPVAAPVAADVAASGDAT